MKKSSFAALILGTVSGFMFAMGMCMALLPEWNAFTEGIVFGAIGLVLGLVTIAVWRKMEGKHPVKLSARRVLIFVFGVLGALVLGVGMCLCLVWNSIVWGTVVGLLGIVMLISLLPLIKGIK